MIIRKAVLADAREIRDIALSRRVSSNSNERSGLIDYNVPNEEKYSKRILKGLFYVAQDFNKLVGFIDSYPCEILNEIFGNDPVIRELIKAEQNAFVYSNTLSVVKEYEGRRVSSKLFRQTIIDIDKKYNSLIGVIVHKPLENKTSMKFAKREGFILKYECDMRGITFGVYKKQLS